MSYIFENQKFPCKHITESQYHVYLLTELILTLHFFRSLRQELEMSMIQLLKIQEAVSII